MSNVSGMKASSSSEIFPVWKTINLKYLPKTRETFFRQSCLCEVGIRSYLLKELCDEVYAFSGEDFNDEDIELVLVTTRSLNHVFSCATREKLYLEAQGCGLEPLTLNEVFCLRLLHKDQDIFENLKVAMSPVRITGERLLSVVLLGAGKNLLISETSDPEVLWKGSEVFVFKRQKT
jgi:hypothetical protein